MKNILFAVLLLSSIYVKSQTRQFRIKTTYLTGNIYVYTSFGLPDGKTPFPANGLYMITNEGIVLIDTPWDEDQTQQLMDTLQSRYKKKIELCISTHYHNDRTSGLDLLKKHGVKTYSSELTRQLAKQKGEKQPQFTFRKDTTFKVGDLILQTYYPGEGHTKDNIVIWLPQSKVLYGGCLIKSLEANNPGYTGDASMTSWPASIIKVKNRYKNIKYIIPRHQGWKGDTLMLTHTLAVLKQN